MKKAKDTLGVLTLNNGYSKKIIETKKLKHIKSVLEEICKNEDFLEIINNVRFVDFEEFGILDEKTGKVIGYNITFVIGKETSDI